MRIWKKLERIVKNEEGQVVVEYAILAFAVSMSAWAIMSVFMYSIQRYFENITWFIASPFP